MGFNNQLSLLAKVDGATSISTILLVIVNVRSFPPYLYVPIHPLEKIPSKLPNGWGASGSEVLAPVGPDVAPWQCSYSLMVPHRAYALTLPTSIVNVDFSKAKPLSFNVGEHI